MRSARSHGGPACHLQYPNFNASLAADLARGFALDPHIEKPMYMLSAGSKRKVWLCAAFAAGTPLTLIDEPFAALDMASIRFLHGLLGEASNHAGRAWVRGRSRRARRACVQDTTRAASTRLIFPIQFCDMGIAKVEMDVGEAHF